MAVIPASASDRAHELLGQMLGPEASFRDGQLQAIVASVEERARTLIVQRTGWGKSLVYSIASTTAAKVRQRHSPPLKIGEVCQVLAEGMESAVQDRESFAAWRSTKIPRSDLEKWVDGPVAAAWGPLAAACVFGISTTGVDRRPVQPFKKIPPHLWPLPEGSQVPGTHAPCEDGYEIAQVLAWVAAQRANVAERLRWRGQIRGLLSHLLP